MKTQENSLQQRIHKESTIETDAIFYRRRSTKSFYFIFFLNRLYVTRTVDRIVKPWKSPILAI